MQSTFSSPHVVLLRRNRWLLALACLPLALTYFFAFALKDRVDSSVILVLHNCIVVEIVLLHYLIKNNSLPGTVHGHLVADERGVFLDKERILSREQIKHGVIAPGSGGGPVVALERRYFLPSVELRARNDDEARGLLQALKLDASQSVVTFSRPYWRVYWFTAGILTGGLISLHPLGVPAFLPVLGLMSAVVYLIHIALGTHVRVGADGLVIRRFGRSRVVSYDALDSVGAEEAGSGRDAIMVVRFFLKSGEQIKIPFLRDARTSATLVGRINDALLGHSEGVAPGDEAMLMRGGRETRVWVRSLRALGSGASASHRSQGVDPGRLLAIAENPSASPTMRASAAVALSTLDEQSRGRLRGVAEATVMPKMRVAIEAAARGLGEEELERALAEVEAEEEAAARERA